MGLDQYLYAKKYLTSSGFLGEKNAEQYNTVVGIALPNGGAITQERGIPSAFVEVKIAQWRKANAIHQWFVDNCQGGEDDCREAYVSREQLEELKELCEKVLADHSLADEELPTQSGFFFGSTEYDEWYFGDLEMTVEMLEHALTLGNDLDFYYSSSW